MKRILLVGVVSFWAGAGAAQAVTITLDYTHDTFFAGNATAQATLEKAASDVSFAITSTLNALSQDVYVGTSGSASASANWRFTYTNPVTDVTETLNTFNLAANSVNIFVGLRPLTGSTLGVGGPSGGGFSGSFAGSGADLTAAVNAMETASNASMPRGGPTLGTLAADYGGNLVSLQYGYAFGSLAFDNDTNNDSIIDNSAALDAFWHFDYNTPVEAGKNDFYSVAVHEILHALGIGTGETWDAHVSGTNWTGTEVINELGTGTGVLFGDQAHIAEGLQGNPLVDGVFDTGILQEAIMDPNLTTGTRKYITTLDLAFLRDMGWDTVVVPEPSAASLLAGAIVVLGWRRRQSFSRSVR